VSVNFISGKPGGGKTLYAVKLILEELIYGNRPIYTNIPLNPGALSEYIQKTYPNKSIDLLTRLVLLDDDTQTPKFWTIRPGQPSIPLLTAAQWSAGEKPKYENITDSGVFYAIDEIHNFFNARAWQETGRDVLFYLSQHRKLGDTVICITQAIGNVDKQFRSVTQDFTYLRNLNKERMGLFRLPSVFVRKTYGSPATDTSQAMESGTFTLDVSGIASCYNTAQGVSIHGKSADLGEKKSGLPVWVFIVGVPAIIFAIVWGVPRGIAKMFSPDKAVAKIQASSQPTETRVITNHVTNALPLQSFQTNVATLQQSTNIYVKPLVVMVDRLFGPWRVTLDNGESYTMAEGLEEITKNHVIILGVVYRYKRPEPGPPMERIIPPTYQTIPTPTTVSKESVEVVYFGKRDKPTERRGLRPPIEQTQATVTPY